MMLPSESNFRSIPYPEGTLVNVGKNERHRHEHPYKVSMHLTKRRGAWEYLVKSFDRVLAA